MLLRLSVNLSVQQLQHDSWLSIVEEALSASGLAAAISRPRDHRKRDHHASGKGGRDAGQAEGDAAYRSPIDDFGTGYSSLSYLARLPIQAVKIDQRFVHGLEQNPNDEAITQAIIALSHSLGLRVIAEGVETAAQFEFLKRPRLRGGAGLPDLASARRSRHFAPGGKCRTRRIASSAARSTCGRGGS